MDRLLHTLQLNCCFETAPSFKAPLHEAHSIVKKVNKSAKATENLIKKTKKKLVSNCPTLKPIKHAYFEV